uniref:Uncharacterized protein n=1 Tax=Panagrolaimus sp. PS1159 TaxID=55785 RepID=A0AC35GJK1_9BILA
MKFIVIVLLFLFCKFANGIYLNPYSYGSYDPAAEDPNLYNYYARYYNPNKHNPYAPYPTYMKPGVFRLPRMYQIDPAWAPYYPPNRFETLPLAQVSHPSSGLSNDGCSSGCGGGESNDPRSSPTFEGGEGAPQSGCSLCDEYGNPKPPPPIEGGGCVQCGGVGGNEGSTDNIAGDTERLPLDRINSSPESDSSGFPNPSGSSSNFYRNKRRLFNIRRY